MARDVENVMWEQSQVFFVTINLPGGSNNDADPWFSDSPPAETAAQTAARTAEIARLTAADLRWLDAAFTQAQQDGAEAVVIGLQADMWDPEKGSAHVANYKPFVDTIAAHASAFGKPVLLFNGDSHVYRSDNPLTIAAPCQIESGAATMACAKDAAATQVPNYPSPGDYPSVSNFHRVVVHGSTLPMEWLRLTITPGADAPAGPTGVRPVHLAARSAQPPLSARMPTTARTGWSSPPIGRHASGLTPGFAALVDACVAASSSRRVMTDSIRCSTDTQDDVDRESRRA